MSQNKQVRLLALAAFMLCIALPACVGQATSTPEPTWPPDATAVRVRLVTTSDWTTFGLLDGATWLRPSRVAASPEATDAWLEGDRFLLTQPMDAAQAGETVEMIIDIFITGWESGGTLVFDIGRGDLGSTRVELSKFAGDAPVIVEAVEWGGTAGTDGRNTFSFQVSTEVLLNTAP